MDKLLPRSIPSYSKPKGWASEKKNPNKYGLLYASRSDLLEGVRDLGCLDEAATVQ